MTTATALEALLTGSDAFEPAELAALDEREEFPARAARALDEAGLAAHYILSRGSETPNGETPNGETPNGNTPNGNSSDRNASDGVTSDGDTPHGGLPETVRLLRAVARRDLTVAIAHGKTFLGSVPVWIAGTPEQSAALAGRVLAGDTVCWGLTERGHGADLLAGEFSATALDGDGLAGDGRNGDGRNGGELGGGWRLDGEKWLINNATRSALACVLARTDPAGGARGFSLFLVDKKALPEGSWRPLPKVRTHGIRGADISGFALDRAEIPAGALIGEEGGGLPVVLKSLQLTRITCVSLSLGATDHALRLAREFAAGRELYGRRLSAVPHVRRALGRAAAQALTAEAVTLLSTRSVHTLPGELSVVSALTKAFVPSLVQRTLTGIGELLGVRGFLTSPPGGGFAKLERDHRIVSIFDGSTTVNRAALISQLPRLGRQLAKGRTDAEGLRTAADLTAPLPAFDPARLALLSPTGCSAVQALPEAVERAALPFPSRLLDGLATDASALVPATGGLPSTAFALAERYEHAYAAAACLLLWLENPPLRTGRLGKDALWLRACLAALADEDDTEAYDALADVLLDRSAPEFTLLEATV
ncbi:acyl-CoA dehydrogenase [Streptomyces sp. NPDC004539]|uniref:acyl-CoA dehydrogenase n=1 Tax=Streptomyces sp. NPDC004539 TaxID=3154280 RepID=UPI0033B729BB